MTQQNIQTTNPALEQFKRIMLERRGFKASQQTIAGATVADWRKSVKSLKDARNQIEKKNRDTAEKRAPTDRVRRAIEFIQSEKRSGHERPISKSIAATFGVNDGWARELIRREFGYCQKRNWNTDTPRVNTIVLHNKVRAYLAELTVRPTLAAVSIMFCVGHVSAMKLIHERFGDIPPKPPKQIEPVRPMAHIVRANAAREWLATQTERPSSIRTFRAAFHIGYEPAIRLLDERFGKAAK